jgi:hypothetical protein
VIFTRMLRVAFYINTVAPPTDEVPSSHALNGRRCPVARRSVLRGAGSGASSDGGALSGSSRSTRIAWPRARRRRERRKRPRVTRWPTEQLARAASHLPGTTQLPLVGDERSSRRVLVCSTCAG